MPSELSDPTGNKKEGPAYQVEGLELFLSVIPKDDLAEYGFENEAQLQAVQLEEPFQLCTVLPQAVQERTHEGLEAVMSATPTWYFPLSVDGQVRALLITTREGECYRAVGIGRVQLARELGRARAQWPAAQGHRLKLVSVFQATSQAEFVLREGGGESAGLAPLATARRVLGEATTRSGAADALQPLEAHDVLRRLKAAAEGEHRIGARPPHLPANTPADLPAKPAPVMATTRGSSFGITEEGAVPEVPDRQQLMPHWCWVAMAQTMLARHDIILEQCYLIQWALDAAGPNTDNVCGNMPDYAETGVGSHEIQLNWGVPGSIFPRPLTWAEVKSEIDSGNPVSRNIEWPGGGHYTVVRGYSVVNATWHLVDIMDPGCGDCSLVYYDTAVNDGTVVWVRSRTTEFINQSYSQGVVGYRDHSARRIYAFVRGDDQHLYVNYWNGSTWKWSDQGTPPDTVAIWDPAVVTYRDGGTQRIYAFITGDNNHLYVRYWDGGQWQWADQGMPAGTQVSGGPGVVAFKEDFPDYNQGNAPRIYAFVRGQDGHLHVNYWDGSIWQWADQGTPPGTQVQSMPAAITFRQDRATQIHAFVLGADGRLYTNYLYGGNWHWFDQGTPAGVKIVSHAHVVTYREKDQVKIFAFVRGDDGHLYVRYYDGAWHWSDRGTPPGTKVSQLSPGAVTYRQDDLQRIYAFVTGENGHLYRHYWDGLLWQWADQGTPPGTKVAETSQQHPGVLTYRKGNTRKIFAFVMGANHRVYMNYWEGADWKWEDRSP